MIGTTRFHVLTLFPEMVLQGMAASVLGRACEKNIIALNAVNIRDYTADRHGKVDDYTYGGGAGMLMQAQPVYDAHMAVSGGKKIRTIYVTPQGTPFTQAKARELAKEEELIFLCGHYEGIDERVLEEIVDDYISIGDYVLTGGELPAMVMIDAIVRLIPGVLGNDFSAEEESFDNGLLEYPQYSRPEEWHGKRVPKVLLSGDHKKVAQWRLEEAARRTRERRPDLYERYQEKQSLIKALARHKRDNIHMMESLARGRAEILYGNREEIPKPSVLLYDQDSKTCMAIATNACLANEIAERLPEETKRVILSDLFLKEALLQRHYQTAGEYSQVLYTRREVLRVKHKDIRPLTMEHYSYICGDICQFYLNDPKSAPGSDPAYIRERIQAGAMYGAFLEGSLAGFIGIHAEGSLGMLFVEEPFRRQGIAASLESWLINRMLERGWVPYGYIESGNRAAESLQEKLGLYQSKKTFWRMEKHL